MSRKWEEIGPNYDNLTTSQINRILKTNLTEQQQRKRQWKWILENTFKTPKKKKFTWDLRSEDKKYKNWFYLIRPKGQLPDDTSVRRFEREQTPSMNFMYYVLLMCWVIPQLKDIAEKINYYEFESAKNDREEEIARIKGAKLFQMNGWNEENIEKVNITDEGNIEDIAKAWIRYLIEENYREQKKHTSTTPTSTLPKGTPMVSDIDYCTICDEPTEWDYYPKKQEKVCKRCGTNINYDPMQYVPQSKYNPGSISSGVRSKTEVLTDLQGIKYDPNKNDKDAMKDALQLTVGSELFDEHQPKVNIIINNSILKFKEIENRLKQKKGINRKVILIYAFQKSIDEENWGNIVDHDELIKNMYEENYDEIRQLEDNPSKELREAFNIIEGDSEEEKEEEQIIQNINDINARKNKITWDPEGINDQYEELKMILESKGFIVNTNSDNAALIYIIMKNINGDKNYTKGEIAKLFGIGKHNIKEKHYLSGLTNEDKDAIKLVYPYSFT